jgi:hypothetical protein
MKKIITRIAQLCIFSFFAISELALAGEVDKKNGLSCFSLNSSGQLSVINCSAPADTSTACVVTSGTFDGVIFSCGSSELTIRGLTDSETD